MPDPGYYARREQTAQQQTQKIGRDDKTDQRGREPLNLGAHPEQGRKQTVGEEQQSVAEQK